MMRRVTERVSRTANYIKKRRKDTMVTAYFGKAGY